MACLPTIRCRTPVYPLSSMGLGHGRPDRIKIHIGHAGQKGRLIQNGLTLKAALSEVASYSVFLLGPLGGAAAKKTAGVCAWHAPAY